MGNMKTTQILNSFTNGAGTWEDLAVYTRMENVEAKWTLYRLVNSITGRVKYYGVRYHKAGACLPGDLEFTSLKAAFRHLDSITNARRVA
jgi:hypothetical protein